MELENHSGFQDIQFFFIINVIVIQSTCLLTEKISPNQNNNHVGAQHCRKPLGQRKGFNISSTVAHCTFSSNLFHGYIVQKYIDQMSPPENKKCSPGKVFGIKPPSNPWTFEQERPQRPGCEAVSTLHQPKKDML